MISLLPRHAQQAAAHRFECASLDIPQPVTVNDLIPDVIDFESEEVLRLLPFALYFAPRGAELRQLAYTKALQREFRCSSINGVCSESPARNGLRPPTQQ